MVIYKEKIIFVLVSIMVIFGISGCNTDKSAVISGLFILDKNQENQSITTSIEFIDSNRAVCTAMGMMKMPAFQYKIEKGQVFMQIAQGVEVIFKIIDENTLEGQSMGYEGIFRKKVSQ